MSLQVITMDLAAAKIALYITWHGRVKFSNVIVQLGAFHIMCTYLGAIGKMIAGSGFEELSYKLVYVLVVPSTK